MVIAGDQQHTTVLGGPCMIHVLEHVTAAINARAFAVPECEYTIVFGRPDQAHGLCAPDCGSGEVFVDTGYKLHMMRIQMFLRFPECLVQHTEWRAAVAAEKASGIQTGGGITQSLHHGQSHQRLNTREINTSVDFAVLVVQRDVGSTNGGEGGRSGGSLGVSRHGSLLLQVLGLRCGLCSSGKTVSGHRAGAAVAAESHGFQRNPIPKI